MALDSLWYYSQKDEKRGPVTSSEIHRLAHRQKIHPEDLVWCHGMESWVPARTIRGMFPEDDDAGLLTDMFDAPRTQIKPDPEASEEPPGLEQVNHFDPVRQESNPQLGYKAIQYVQTHGRIFIVSSFLLILFCQGCEVVGERHVRRQQSSFQLAQLAFTDRYDRKIAGFEQEILSLRSLAVLSAEQAQTLQQQNAQLADVKNERAIEMARLENDRWSRMRMSAHSTEAYFTVWSYYRQILLVLATMVLAAGLFGRFFCAKQTEKWFCALLLLLIAASVYLDQAFRLSENS